MAAFPDAPSPFGNATALNITTATVVKSSPGVPVTVSVIVAGSTNGAIYDGTSTTGNGASNQVASVSASGPVNMPCASGIVVIPGTGQTLALSYI